MIITQVSAIARSSAVNGAFPVQLQVGWDEEDPMAVTLDIAAPDGLVTWLFGRDLLSKGLVSAEEFGQGDVQLHCESGPGGSMLYIDLSSEEGCAHLVMPRQPIQSFLNKTARVVPVGAEDVTEAIDDLLADILN